MSATRRRAPNKTERIAACLLMLKVGEEWLIPEPLRSTGTAAEICACVEWDHAFQHALGGDTRPQNITPLLVAAHKDKTNGKPHLKDGDKSIIAKSKRIQEEHEEFRARLLAKDTGEAPPRQKAKSKAKMRGGRSDRLKIGFGKVVDRETGAVVWERGR